ncbi:hypothetical protein E2C01_086274 [Portunus trituberculatus]|uniref:Uncharacterized protein n=1 Tax=Portunus trituberculatus TaxID=210409 RepID=A0A5B7J3C8_PORTR|nr:hypothetical protein [Portunus trituberculatus]
MAVVLRRGKFLGIAVPREPARKARIPHIWVAHFPDGEGRPVFTLPPSIPCTRPPVCPSRACTLRPSLTASFVPPHRRLVSEGGVWEWLMVCSCAGVTEGKPRPAC